MRSILISLGVLLTLGSGASEAMAEQRLSTLLRSQYEVFPPSIAP